MIWTRAILCISPRTLAIAIAVAGLPLMAAVLAAITAIISRRSSVRRPRPPVATSTPDPTPAPPTRPPAERELPAGAELRGRVGGATLPTGGAGEAGRSACEEVFCFCAEWVVGIGVFRE